MGVTVFGLRRLVSTLIVLLGVATATFFLTRMSGDPVDQMLPMGAPVEAKLALRKRLGLNQPLPIQYGKFLSATARGDFGNSIRYSEPALTMYLQRLPATIELVIGAVIVTILVGVGAGILAAVNHGKVIDSVVMGGALIGQAVPAFYLGLMSILLFSLQLHWLPTGGRGEFRQLFMPVLVLSGYYTALMARITRTAVLETMRLEFVRTAMAKGLGRWRVLGKHVMRPALIPIVTLLGLQIGGLFSGAVIAETVFTWPGVGRLAVEAIYARDFPVVQTTVIMSACIFVLVNFSVDLLYAVIDPRIKYA